MINLFGKVLWRGVGLGIGLVVMGVSLNQLHRDSWAVQYGRGVGERVLGHVRSDLVSGLPESGVLPGNVLYPVQVAMEKGWMYLGEEMEQDRRKLWLSHQRLRMGYELVAQGKQVEGVETLTRAMAYLEDAVRGVGGVENEQWGRELEWSVMRHEQVLVEVEQMVDEELRPRITELRNVPMRCGTEISKI